MAKFCGNCGAELDNTAKVCGQCGTPLDDNPPKVSGIKIVAPDKQKKNKKIITIVSCLTTLFVTIVILGNVVSNFTGSKGLLRKVMAAYEKYDIDSLALMSSDIYYYGEDTYFEYYFEYNIGDVLDSFEISVGHNFKLSYKVNEIYTLSDRKLNELLEDIEYMYPDFDVSMIKKVVVADLTLTAKQGSKSVDRDLKVTMSKENNSWKLIYIE